MAIKFFKSIDLTNNELQNAKLHLTGSAPSALEGAIYFDTGVDKAKIYVDGGVGSQAWQNIAFESWAEGQFLEDSEVTTFAKSILDDVDAAAVRTTIGVDAAGTDNSTNVTLSNTNYLSLSGQEITGGTIPITAGGTGSTSASAARTALGVDAAGTDNSGVTVTSSSVSKGGTTFDKLALGTTASTALAGNTTVDDVSNANLLAALAALESTGGAADQNITIGTDPGDTIVITGNLTVSGTTTTLNTETVTIEDNIILLNSNVTGSGNGTDAGIEVERGDDQNVSLFWDESVSAWTVSNTQGTYEILQSVGGTTFKVNLDAAESSVSKTGNTYTVTHSLGTKDVIVQVVDVSGGVPTYETVFTENQRPTDDTVTVSFASSVTDGDYRVLISQV